MVKKTDSIKKIGTTVKVSSVDSVDSVKSAGRIRQATRPMSAAEKEAIFKLIDEEAERLNNLSESRKMLVVKSVKMALEAGEVDEDDKK